MLAAARALEGESSSSVGTVGRVGERDSMLGLGARWLIEDERSQKDLLFFAIASQEYGSGNHHGRDAQKSDHVKDFF